MLRFNKLWSNDVSSNSNQCSFFLLWTNCQRRSQSHFWSIVCTPHKPTKKTNSKVVKNAAGEDAPLRFNLSSLALSTFFLSLRPGVHIHQNTSNGVFDHCRLCIVSRGAFTFLWFLHSNKTFSGRQLTIDRLGNNRDQPHCLWWCILHFTRWPSDQEHINRQLILPPFFFYLFFRCR